MYCFLELFPAIHYNLSCPVKKKTGQERVFVAIGARVVVIKLVFVVISSGFK